MVQGYVGCSAAETFTPIQDTAPVSLSIHVRSLERDVDGADISRGLYTTEVCCMYVNALANAFQTDDLLPIDSSSDAYAPLRRGTRLLCRGLVRRTFGSLRVGGFSSAMRAET